MKANRIIILLLILIQGVSNGQSVEDFIAQAKEYNPGLKALQLEYEAAKFKADQVNDWPDPVVNFRSWCISGRNEIGGSEAEDRRVPDDSMERDVGRKKQCRKVKG